MCFKRQVAAVLKTSNKAFELKHIDVQCQVGGSDCGLFAIAFATALCFGLDPHTCSFAQAEMRNHLTACFESQCMSTFPASDRGRRFARHRILCRKKCRSILCV